MPMPSSHPKLRLCSDSTPLEERDDDELMLLTGAGVNDAFATLVARHQRQVRTYCTRICRSSMVGDDLAQEIFVTLWQSRHGYEARGRFRAYLFSIALSRCKNELRRRRAALPATADSEGRDLAADQLDELIAIERQKRLHACVDRLPEDQRQAILLRYAAELDYAAIAQLVKRSEATVRSRVFFGLNRLRKLVGKWGQG